MKVLIFDGYNLLHRSKSGFQLGPAPIVFNFFRALRSLVEKFNPDKCYFVLEGEPRQKKSYKEYKANRIQDFEEDTDEHRKLLDFIRQKDVIIQLLTSKFPLCVTRNPEFEADDVIYNIIKKYQNNEKITLISNDTDFIQLLNEFSNVKIWNAMQKKFVKQVEYDYVTWKSLTGDGSDNIKGISGIGKVTAEELCRDKNKLNEFLNNDITIKEKFELNYDLIKLREFSQDDWDNTTIVKGDKSWDCVKSVFEKYKFNSIINDKSWNKFIKTFDHL